MLIWALSSPDRREPAAAYVFSFPAWRAHRETMIFLCEIENGQRDTQAHLAGLIHDNTQ